MHHMSDRCWKPAACATALLLGGCADTPQRSPPVFRVPPGVTLTITPNDPAKAPMVLQDDVLAHLISENWSGQSLLVLQTSSLSENAKYSALAIRAFQSVAGNGCTDHRLLSITPTHAPHAASAPASAGKRTELWKVDACGAVENMPVTDE